jgi:hypothetical protein
VPDVDAEDPLKLSAVEDEEPVEALAPDAPDPALDVRVRIRRPDRYSDHPDPAAVEDGVEGAAELCIAVMDQEPGPVVDVHQQVARLLQHPGAVGVARAGHVLNPAAADADEDQYIQPPQQYGVDGQEVAGECRRSVLAQERAPVLLVALGRRRNTRRSQDVAYQRGGDADAEFAQLADDPDIAPTGVLARQSQDEFRAPRQRSAVGRDADAGTSSGARRGGYASATTSPVSLETPATNGAAAPD